MNRRGFFREPETWELLNRKVLSGLLATKGSDTWLRAWVSGCGSGEDAYTLGMLLLEKLGPEVPCGIRIFATDTDLDALRAARAGLYLEEAVARVSAVRRARFFTREGQAYRVVKPLRAALVFAEQDLLADPPFPALDLICCRRHLLSLPPAIQEKAVALLHLALAEGGYLVLGAGDAITRRTDLFTPLTSARPVYRRVGPLRDAPVSFPVVPRRRLYRGRPHRTADGRTRLGHTAVLAQRRLAACGAAAGVVVTPAGMIQYFAGSTDDYLWQPSGAPTYDLLATARSGLRAALRDGLQTALRTKVTVTVEARVRRGNGFHPVRAALEHLDDGDAAPDLLLVWFREAPEVASASSAAAPVSAVDTRTYLDLERELQIVRQDLQSTIEDMGTLNDELQAANEETMSANEELQASVEELTESQRQLQLLNEERMATNRALEHKVEDLRTQIAERQRLAEQLRQSEERWRLLLHSVRDYAIYMLDPEGHVLSWSAGAEEIKGYTAEEILGKHFSCFYLSEDVAQGKPARDLRRATQEGRYEDEGWRRRRDGSRFWASSHLSVLRDQRGQLRGFARVTQDITARKVADDRIAELSGRILTSQDEERRRIGHELHDSTAQGLVAAAMSLTLVQQAAARLDPAARRALDEGARLIEQCASEIRTISYLLHPPLLDEVGLLSAIRWYADGFAQRSRIGVKTDLPDTLVRMSQEVETALFRVVQECLTNIHRHARSASARIRVEYAGATLQLAVEDDGCGIAPEQLRAFAAGDSRIGIGLIGMRERVQQLGGEFEIRTHTGGTTVTVRMPVAPAQAPLRHTEPR